MMDPKLKKELHDKLLDLRMKLYYAKLAQEDTSLIDKEIKDIRLQIAKEVAKDMEEQNKKGR